MWEMASNHGVYIQRVTLALAEGISQTSHVSAVLEHHFTSCFGGGFCDTNMVVSVVFPWRFLLVFLLVLICRHGRPSGSGDVKMELVLVEGFAEDVLTDGKWDPVSGAEKTVGVG